VTVDQLYRVPIGATVVVTGTGTKLGGLRFWTTLGRSSATAACTIPHKSSVRATLVALVPPVTGDHPLAVIHVYDRDLPPGTTKHNWPASGPAVCVTAAKHVTDVLPV
jgi:hypothetical protein